LKIETKEKTSQNHYHEEEENPSNFHQKFLSTNLRWESFCKTLGGKAFVKALVGTTTATVVIMAKFTLVQANDVIFGPTPTVSTWVLVFTNAPPSSLLDLKRVQLC